MENEVTGTCEPFDERWIDNLDKMSRKDALVYLDRLIKRCVQVRNYYEHEMLTHGVAPGHLNAWCIDNNNIIRFKRLYDEIAAEE